MEPIPNEGGQNLSSLFSFFSFSEWKKSVHDPKIRRIELTLIFGIGILLGIVGKDIAGDTLTIGYQDYTVQTPANRVDFNAIEREVLRGGDASSSSNSAQTCSE